MRPNASLNDTSPPVAVTDNFVGSGPVATLVAVPDEGESRGLLPHLTVVGLARVAAHGHCRTFGTPRTTSISWVAVLTISEPVAPGGGLRWILNSSLR